MAEARRTEVLVIIAHPDDEVFVSGTICLCAEKGFRVEFVCATDGEGGSRALLQPGEGPDELGRIRRQEVSLSARALGAAGVEFIAAPDVPPNSWADGEPWDVRSVAASMAKIILARAPQVILTHGPKGGYGHPAHCCVSRCVMAAVEQAGFDGSVYAICGKVKGAFFSWRFDDPSDVIVDARGFLKRRSTSLSCHQTEAQFFLSPYAPRTPRRLASALLGLALWFTEWGRKRLPVITPERFFRRFPKEGLTLLRAPPAGKAHFFADHLSKDPRVRLVSARAAA